MNGKSRFKQRVFALILVSFILVAVFPFGVFAEAINSNGTFSDGTNWLDFFGASETPFLNMLDSAETFVSTHGNNLTDLNNIPTLGLSRQNEDDWSGYFDDIKDLADFQIYNSAIANNVEYDLTNNTYHVIFAYNNGTITFAQCFYFWTENRHNVYFVGGSQGNYIASDDELHCFYQEVLPTTSDYITNAGAYDYYIEQNQGVYYMPFPAISNSSGTTPIALTDCSVYCSTASGNSGFTNSGFSGGTADFDFSEVSSYYDFNLPKTSGDFTDPNAPVQPPVEETLAKYYMKFSDTTYYAGSDIMHMFHVNTFTFNEYQVQHPEQYKLKFHYEIALNAHSNAGIIDWPLDNYYYYDATVDVASMMAQNKRHNSPSQVAVNISANLFNTSDGQHNLRDVLKNVVHEIDGTSAEVANPGTIFDQSAVVQTVQNWGNLVGDFFYSTENIPKSLPPVVLNRFVNSASQYAIHDMRITCEVRLMDANNSNNHSYPYKDYYDFVRGDYKVISTMSTDEVNQLPEVLNDAPLITNNGGGGATNNGTVVNNYITGASGGGAELVKVWTPFTLSEVSYANTHGMFQDILEFMDAESENGFLPVVKQVFSFLPDTIWTYLTISIACICGFAVIRFALKR